MTRFFKFVSIFHIILIFFPNLTVFGQPSDGLAHISSDSLLHKARELAYNNGKAEARKICRLILWRDSTYLDAAVLMGRTYAWDQKYDSARIVLNKVIGQRAGHYEAVDALIDTELWSDNYQNAIKYADVGLSFYPNDETYLLKKSRALNNSGNPKRAYELLNQLLATNASNKDAASLLLSIKRDRMVNKLTVSYGTYVFDHDRSWIFSSVSIGRKTSSFGTVTLRSNYARRFGNDGYQFEVDAYPSIAKGIYMYFNTGISNRKNFPYSRLSMEPYFKLPASFEMSVGFRYLNFDENRIAAIDSNKVMIYTGTFGKYYGNYWFSVRPYFVPGEKGWSKSVNLTVRRYLADSESYISLILGTGISPDEQQYAFDQGLYYLKSNKIEVDYQQKIASRFYLNCGTGFAREELQAGSKRNRYTFDFGVSILF